MSEMSEISDFENPWRKNYELKMFITWSVALLSIFWIQSKVPIPIYYSIVINVIVFIFVFFRGMQALKRYENFNYLLNSTNVEFISIKKLCKVDQKKKDSYWIGYGFEWSDAQAKKLYFIINSGVKDELNKHVPKEFPGSYWIHGLYKEMSIFMHLNNLVGHTLIVGTTRVGKTRMLDLLIAQAIIRDEPVIIIDPKGDHGLAENARKICAIIGKPDKFVYFSPAHPDKSVVIDTMRNWNRTTELASRIASLIPSETGSDPFTAFGWKVINDITNGLFIVKKQPTLLDYKQYVEVGIDDLLYRTLSAYFDQNIDDWNVTIQSFLPKGKGSNNVEMRLNGYIKYYKEFVFKNFPSVEINGLISMFDHDRDHFGKMVATLIPILSMLTSYPLNELLSPSDDILTIDKKNTSHVLKKIPTDISKILIKNQCLYAGLDSLSDPTVGSAIGSVLLSDATAVAGSRYNYGDETMKPVNIFIDEAAEVLNTPTIQMMNKGGGAKFRVTIATQTFADFAARLGDKDKAIQVLANTNNKIALRVLDPETQKYFTDGMQTINFKSMDVRYGHSVDANIQDEYTASYQETSQSEEKEIIPPAILSELPPLHFFARFSGGKIFKGRIPIISTDE